MSNTENLSPAPAASDKVAEAKEVYFAARYSLENFNLDEPSKYFRDHTDRLHFVLTSHLHITQDELDSEYATWLKELKEELAKG